MAVISGEPVRYPCSASASEESLTPRVYCGLLGTLHRAKVWTADKVCFSVAPSDGGPPFKLLKREAGIVHRLWESSVRNLRIIYSASCPSFRYWRTSANGVFIEKDSHPIPAAGGRCT